VKLIIFINFFFVKYKSVLSQKQKSIKGCILNYRYEFVVNIYILFL